MMIAIIGAMKLEVDALLQRMTDVQDQPWRDIPFYTGKLAGQPVVVTQSGVAKTNAARSTTVLMERFDVDGVINIGTAGGLRAEQEVLDVVVSTQVAHHDVEVPGWTSGFCEENPCCYTADPHYVQLIRDIISQQDRVWTGPIASGDSFICRMEQVEAILRRFPQALCAEMEAAAIAQVCSLYGKPFVIIRSLSDITLKEGNEMTFEEYAVRASSRSALWCESFVDRLARTQ